MCGGNKLSLIVKFTFQPNRDRPTYTFAEYFRSGTKKKQAGQDPATKQVIFHRTAGRRRRKPYHNGRAHHRPQNSLSHHRLHLREAPFFDLRARQRCCRRRGYPSQASRRCFPDHLRSHPTEAAPKQYRGPFETNIRKSQESLHEHWTLSTEY